MRKYNIILADPPWSYRDKAHVGKRGAEYKYSCMTMEEIKSLPVSHISADNAALFLWCTGPQLPVGLEVLSAWGFKFKNVAFTWVKRNKKSPSWFWGMGHYTRSNAEFCLLGIKGRMKRISASVHSVIDTPIEGHSKKPSVVRDKIVELFGDVSRIELFARQNTTGWDATGLDYDKNYIANYLRGYYG